MNEREAEVFRAERMNRHDDFVAYMDAAKNRNEPKKGPIELCDRFEINVGVNEEMVEALREMAIQRRNKSEGKPVDKEAVKREFADLGRWAYAGWAWAERNL